MARRKSYNQYYFPLRLQDQLAQIPNYSLTLVKAPSGFGKTTAVREYLESMKKEGKGIVLKWYTCLCESPEKTWIGICKLFDHLDSATGDFLASLGVPRLETLPDIVALLQKYRSQKKAYLVIDNYQLFGSHVQNTLLAVLASCRNKKLHIVVITQPLEYPLNDTETTQSATVYHAIVTEDFVFDNTSIADYCNMLGIAITDKEIEHLQASSQGWIAAIRLQLKYYRETALFVGSCAIDTLLRTAVWNTLSSRAKEFMMGVSLLDCITRQQIVIMTGGDAVPRSAEHLRFTDFFIRYESNKGAYFVHAILRDFLQKRLACQSQDFIHTMIRRAAAACMAEGDYFQAARFLMRVTDYDAILSMPLTSQYFFNHQGEDVIRFFSQLFRECPPETLLRHPLTVITVGIHFFKRGLQKDYITAVQLMEEFLKNPPGPTEMSERELYRVKGEFEMMRFLLNFNDIAAMHVYHRKAHEYLSHVSSPPRSHLFEGNLPWAAGTASAMSTYWRESGGLQDLLATMDVCLPFYTELVGGQGAGGQIALRAEAAFMRGDDEEAEVLCHQTIYAAQKGGQTSTRICARLILARIGIMRGDENIYATARKDIAKEMEQARQTALTREGELCFALLDLILGKTNSLPDWLHSVEALRRTFYNVTQPHAVMLHCWTLLLEKRWVELYALTEIAIPTARDMHFNLLLVYHLIFLARAKLMEGHSAEAVAHVRGALAIALPDRVYLPFAEHGGVLLPLLGKLEGDFDGNRMQECLNLCHRWAKGTATLRKAMSKVSSVLTARQAEFLSLASEGNSNAQIATRCGVSPDNVNKVLRSAYTKLKVRNRAEAVASFLLFTK